MILRQSFPLATAVEMRELDRKAIEERGTPGVVLMENAGRGCAEVAIDMLEEVQGERAAVFCGPGNNGGDGFVVARHLSNKGIGVDLFMLAPESKVKGDALINLKIIASGPEIKPIQIASEDDLTRQEARITAADLIVDAMFGTGLGREVSGLFLQVVELINEQDKPVVSVDMPSGLCSDTGIPLGWAVQASATVTFGCLKRGQAIFPGADYCGDLYLADIGFPSSLLDDAGIPVWFMGMDSALELLPDRPEDGHKGTFGHVLLIAGRQGFSGAAALAGMGALKAGAGLATVAGTKEGLAASMAHAPELMGHTIEIDNTGEPTDDSLSNLVERANTMDAVAIGPGLGTGEYARKLVHAVLNNVKKPIVLDADAVNVLAGSSDILKKAEAEVILTPHPGEMARLLARKTSEIQADRIELARKVSRDMGVHVVLKGARTVCAEPGGSAWVVPTGNHGLATAGSGDVLTGIIAGLAAQKVEPLDAGRLGAFIHGLAGDLAADEFGPRCITAGNVLEKIGEAFQALEEQDQDWEKS
ncbi:MAG: NAD(P)H-hydrate dehydratase [Deltaproteobacteria bacterium]|nr:NAD(P)H-hydrate dehydratase [Deltaproteobacteria bacterium]